MATENDHTDLSFEEAQPPSTEEAMSDSTIKKAAALAAAGANRYQVQKALKISQYYTNKIWKDELFRKTLTDIGENAVAESKAVTKAELAKLSKKAVKAIEHNLDKNNLQAAITVLRSLGLETSKDDGAKEAGFTLVLAGQKPEPQTIVVKKEGED